VIAEFHTSVVVCGIEPAEVLVVKDFCHLSFLQIPLPTGSAVDASHTGAMFSSGATVTPSVNVATTKSCTIPNVSNSIMHPNVSAILKIMHWLAFDDY
jgi:hypothetical protein